MSCLAIRPDRRRSPHPGFKSRTALVTVALLSGLACHQGNRDHPAAPAEKPELTRLRPDRGYAGTEVVIEGRHLGHPLRVCFKDQPLPGDRYEVQGDTLIRVTLPEDAQGEASLAVTTPAGTSGRTCFVKPSVRTVLQEPFFPVHAVLNPNRMLDFPDYRRTSQGALLQLPLAPVLEPRHGSAAEVGQGCLLNFQLPAPFREVLPASVQRLLQDQGIDPGWVEVLCVSQLLAPDAGPQVFHPHAWIDAKGGMEAHPHGFKAGVALREQAPGVHFEGHEAAAFLEVAPEGPFPENLVLAGLPARGSTAFWSVTRFGTQAVATLHLLLDESDQHALAELTRHADRGSRLLKRLAEAPGLGKAAAFLPFKALFRPRLAGYGRQVELPDPATTTYLHNGTGLTGTRAVTLGGQPVPAFKVLTDGLLRVTVPRGAAGDLRVTTDLGESDPVPVLPALP